MQQYLYDVLIYVKHFHHVNQFSCIKWYSKTSQRFGVLNSVRQGGILSSQFLNVYIYELSVTGNYCRSGSCMYNVVLNNIIYANDMELYAPRVKGLKLLIRFCEQKASRLEEVTNIDTLVIQQQHIYLYHAAIAVSSKNLLITISNVNLGTVTVF